MKQRIAITGIGLVSPHGGDVNAVFDALVRGESAIRLWDDPDISPAVAAHVDFDPAPWFTRPQLSGADRVSQFAVAAADRALKDAALPEIADKERCGIYLGSGMGGAATIEAAYEAYFGARRSTPLSVVAFMCNAAASHISMRQQVTGPVMTYSVACASSAIAIGEAARAIALGEIDVAFAGGTEALLQPGVLQCWQAMKILATPDSNDPSHSCKPFSAERSGLVLAEGAAILLMESMEHAEKRGARIYAELVGYGVRSDAYHLTKPHVDGQVRAINAAMRDARLTPAQIGYCNAHGTATRLGDPTEAESIARVWGADLSKLRVGSTKSLHGHLLGAAGGIEAAITVMAVHKRLLPAHLGGRHDPDCALPLIGSQGEEAPHLKAAMSNSFAFGGTNVSLIFQRHKA